MGATRTAYRTCPLCEATCGLELELDGERLLRVRGDADDVFSRGFLCPKGVALKELHEDPDRIRTPLLRQADGSFAPASWDEAFAVIDARLGGILGEGDRNAVGVYIGNPNAHNLANLLYLPVFLKALGSRNVFSATTVDQAPKQMASALMFGTGLSVPIPDVDRTDHLLILGANPMASNGSLLTAPNMRGRLRAIRSRGGRIVVVDPRRSRTAEEADEHVAIRPGTDALLLFALVHVLFAEGPVDTGPVGEWLSGLDEVEELAAPFPPDAVAPACGVPADTIARMARELAAAPSAAVYGRIGTTTQEFGTLASWLVDVLNALTGNLDSPGGAMFPRAAAGARNASGPPGRGRGARFGRWASRVRGLPEIFGELPSACLAEEMDTRGAGRIRALVTVSGNPGADPRPGDRLWEPGALAPELGAARARARRPRVHGVGRRLPERDDAPRRRHPPRSLPPAPPALPAGLRAALGAERRALLPARCGVGASSGATCDSRWCRYLRAPDPGAGKRAVKTGRRPRGRRCPALSTYTRYKSGQLQAGGAGAAERGPVRSAPSAARPGAVPACS